MGKIILITGGARSGKSTFAEKYVAKNGKRVGYIATAQVFDDEMEFRVKLHQSRRPAEWETFESPFDAHKVISAEAGAHDMFLFDCMTIYISKSPATVVIVTNEVGAGIVPENKLARIYRDLSGLSNQLLAEAAEEVFLVVAGIPVNLKKIRENIQ